MKALNAVQVEHENLAGAQGENNDVDDEVVSM
jgi:hypothetical protein